MWQLPIVCSRFYHDRLCEMRTMRSNSTVGNHLSCPTCGVKVTWCCHCFVVAHLGFDESGTDSSNCWL